MMEPNPGVSQSREQICIDVTEGAVGTTITIVPVWTAGSATGVCVWVWSVGRCAWVCEVV